MGVDYIGIPRLSPDLANFFLRHFQVLQVVAMFAIAAFCALEVAIACLALFKRYRGLYFISMQVSAWGIIIHIIPAAIFFVTDSSSGDILLSVFIWIGFACMASGQPFVLYSRLHLVVPDITPFRWIPCMITLTGVILHIPLAAFSFRLSLGDEGLSIACEIWLRLMVSVFVLQDFIISTVYIRQALRALSPVVAIRGKDGRKVIYHLIAINVVIVVLDLACIIVEWKVPFINGSLTPLVYGLKLKLEFYILNNLRSLVSPHNPYIFHVNHGTLTRNTDNETDCTNTDLRRRSSELNVYDIFAMVSNNRGPRRDLEMANATSPHTPASDPFSINLQVALQNYESRRRRERMPQISPSTPDFHQVLRETSSKENLPPSPAPTMVSFLPESDYSEIDWSGSGAVRRQSEILPPSPAATMISFTATSPTEYDWAGSGAVTRSRIGSLETSSTAEMDLLKMPK